VGDRQVKVSQINGTQSGAFLYLSFSVGCDMIDWEQAFGRSFGKKKIPYLYL
jgi:hypothetical protein